MAVCCRRCGREYDVALFQFGRTIWCACGSRVGLEPELRPLTSPARRRFAADAMLGRLARWLRLLGFDCAYDSAITDEALVRLAETEGRTILTRDRRLPEEWWVPGVYLVRAEDLLGQLAEVIQAFDLAASVRLLTRCNECNRALAPLAREQALGRVPPRVLELHDTFAECPGCGRVYWEGTHAARIRELVEELRARARSGPHR
jgi:uncharacterized protein with PIN domain